MHTGQGVDKHLCKGGPIRVYRPSLWIKVFYIDLRLPQCAILVYIFPLCRSFVRRITIEKVHEEMGS